MIPGVSKSVSHSGMLRDPPRKVRGEICGKLGHSSQQCWRNQAGNQSPLKGYSQTRGQSSRQVYQVYNISEFPQDQPLRIPQ